MLKEISCDKFIENGQVRPPIRLHKGLNAIIGSSDGANSIGKSTFLMIIDFIFGGSDYTKKATDIIDNIGNHTIKFEFEFDNKSYYFSRSTSESTSIWECDKDYNPKKQLKKDDYCHFLKDKYHLPVSVNHVRATISPFIRVWGRSTLNQEKPLKASIDSPDKQGITSLLELFERSKEILEQAKPLEEAIEKRKVFSSAQKYKFITFVENKTHFNDNEKRIKELKQEIHQLSHESDNGLVELDSLQAQQLSDLRRQLSKAKKQQLKLRAQLKTFEEEQNPNKTKFEKDFANLQEFFPDINIKKLSEIEQFHKKLTNILKKEFRESTKELEFLITLTNDRIVKLEEKITSIHDVPNISQSILDQYAELQREITQLQESNQNFITKEKLSTEVHILKEAYNALVKHILQDIQTTLNNLMKQINDEVYDGKKTSPNIVFNSSSSYNFYTPQDRGTGSEYKGLIVFDLAILQQTNIPVVVHDSVLLKQIQDDAIEKILSYYSKQNKQVFIALDKEESYSGLSQEILKGSEILRLFPNGGELFGYAWNNK